MKIEGPDAYLVQGFYFQRRETPGIAYVSIHGAVPVLREELVSDMFAGVIWWDELGMWVGCLFDALGPSALVDIDNDIVVDGSLIHFEKYYVSGAGGRITYDFTRREGGLWVGGYSGPFVGSGDANCVLTPVPEGMLQQPQD